MNLDILLKLLFRNNREDIISRAIQIEKGIQMPYKIDDEIVVEFNNDELKRIGLRFVNRNYGGLKVPIVAVDPYDMDKPYTVITPMNDFKKVSVSDRSTTIHLVESIPPSAPSEEVLTSNIARVKE